MAIRQSGKAIKIVLSGLDNAGKSSMLLVMKRLYQFEQEVKDLLPTQMIDYYTRAFLGFKLHFWDMGGQELYRQRYLERQIYFEQIGLFIYLVDVTAPDRLNNSLDYFFKVLDIMKENGYTQERDIAICFTKMDFEKAFTEKPEFIATLAKARAKIMEKTKDGFKFDFYSTSIYNVYSIVKMISNGLSRCIPGYDIIRKEIEDFAVANQFSQFLLFDQTGLIIADYMNSFKPVDRNSVDAIISENLAYFKKVEDDKNAQFRGFRSTRGSLMNISHKFKLEKDNESPENERYYLAILVEEAIGRKAAWNINELISKLRNLLFKYQVS